MIATSLVSLRAQSLADVARKEEERRKTTPPGKVYTNKDLKPVPAPPATTAADTSADAKDATKTTDKADDSKAGQAAANDTKEPSKDAAKDKDAPKDRAYWAARVKTLQDQLDRDQTYADALQSRINGLTAEFVNRDDPAQRAAIDRERVKSLAELDRLKQAIPLDKKALADLLEEARRAGVPPGWVR
jgi:hypothetical protein